MLGVDIEDWEAVAIVEMRDALHEAFKTKQITDLEPFSLEKFDEMFKG